MKKKVLFAIAILVVLYILFRMSGVFRVYAIPSSSNEPTLTVGSRIIGSSLKRPDRLDFAYFRFSDSLDGWTIVKRLIAQPGDTLECKNGYYYVNNINIDENIDLRFGYKISPIVFDTYVKDRINDIDFFKYHYSDSITAFLDDSFVEKLPVQLDRITNSGNSNLSEEIFEAHQYWTVSNFGPIVLPNGKYFFSGDNRDNSLDSRYRGLVDEDEILGTVLLTYK
ncbi:signal peptidase I [Winogradskyella helgolandensis]|uniref:signal peptidase I n=1 Tax=Winogradskyella helgolandensis TaxID=2697010 RepID=UPI0015BEC81D|nr:signal peptidase I [Winogradskyella helgolandensis]